MKYIDYFLSLKCSPDILEICGPVNKAGKEISEMMTVILRVRKIVLKQPMVYNILDLCAGNGLIGVTAVHFLPVSSAVAVDKRERSRKWDRAKRFKYVTLSIHDPAIYEYIDKNTIIVGSHLCSGLSRRAVELYNNSDAQHLIVLPCCTGGKKDFPDRFSIRVNLARVKLTRYEEWALYLADMCDGKVDVVQDVHCLSPKNIVVQARKEK